VRLTPFIRLGESKTIDDGATMDTENMGSRA
jgi:hypothetical protein